MFLLSRAEPLTPDKIYAGNLAVLGLGYPLWFPQPHASGTPLRGDVGAVLNGRFIRLLHVDTSEAAADKKVIPANLPAFKDIVHFPITTFLSDYMDRSLRPGRYCSHGVRHKEMHATASAPLGGTGALLRLKADHKCHESQGAELTLQSSAHSEVTLSMKFAKTYAAQNFLGWHHYATAVLGLEVDPEDIIFVTGWHKTGNDWATALLRHHTSASTSVNLGAGISGVAAVDLGLSSGETTETSTVQHQGVGYTLKGKHSQRGDDEKDQCVFVKGVRVKARTILPNKIMASAGPHQLPRSGGGAPGVGPVLAHNDELYAYDWQQYAPEGRISDPVNILLEYILEVSAARIAVASDDQVECIFGGRQVLDVPSCLRTARPGVEVNANGVGSLRMEDLVGYQQQLRFMQRAIGPADVSEEPQVADGYRLPHPPNSAADRDEWRQITRKGAGALADSQILLGPTEGKACPVQYKAVVFGDSEKMRINDEDCVSLSADGKLLAAAIDDTIVVWRLQDGLTVQRLERDRHTREISQIAFSPDGEHIVSGADDNLALVWNVKTGDVVHHSEGHGCAVERVAFSPDGTQIATRSRDSLRLWTAWSGDLLHVITDLESNGSIDSLFSPDGSRIATRSEASSSDTAVVLDCRTGERIATLRKQGIRCMAFAPAGDHIATGVQDGSACVWDAASGKALLELKEHTDWVNDVAFSPDGSEVATASRDGAIVTCDSHTGERHFMFRVESVRGNDKEDVDTVAYSPRHNFIACGADDGCVRVWDYKSGTFVAAFLGHSEPVTRVMFTPDGWAILSYGNDYVVRLWSIRDALRLS